MPPPTSSGFSASSCRSSPRRSGAPDRVLLRHRRPHRRRPGRGRADASPCSTCSTRRATRSSGTWATRATPGSCSPAATTGSRRCARRDGISGFLKRDESEHDHFGAGHAGTAMSAALGMAAARDLKGEHYKVVAVVGDGALTCGLSYEGMNNAGPLRPRHHRHPQRQRDVDLAQRRRDHQDARAASSPTRAPTGCASRSRA